MQNVQHKLIEEFERIICVREHLRHHVRENKPKTPEMEAKMISNIAIVNEVIADARTALHDCDALKTLKVLEETKRIP